jgi:uncharacterized membrane protein YkvA (DUF1232 family)
MKAFDQLLKEDIGAYEGRHDDLIFQAPALYRLLVGLLDDPALPVRLRPLVLAAIAYFILPADVIPEDIEGPYGYLDDIYLCAFVADQIQQEADGEGLLLNNWDGEAPLLRLIHDILASDHLLTSDQVKRVLAYIGYPTLSRI